MHIESSRAAVYHRALQTNCTCTPETEFQCDTAYEQCETGVNNSHSDKTHSASRLRKFQFSKNDHQRERSQTYAMRRGILNNNKSNDDENTLDSGYVVVFFFFSVIYQSVFCFACAIYTEINATAVFFTTSISVVSLGL